MNKYQVIVGNIGTVYYGNDYDEALNIYDEYCRQSKDGEGRAAGEDVTLFNDGEPELEQSNCESIDQPCSECEYKNMEHPEDAHCYMFQDKPDGWCAQFKQ